MVGIIEYGINLLGTKNLMKQKELRSIFIFIFFLFFIFFFILLSFFLFHFFLLYFFLLCSLEPFVT